MDKPSSKQIQAFLDTFYTMDYILDKMDEPAAYLDDYVEGIDSLCTNNTEVLVWLKELSE